MNKKDTVTLEDVRMPLRWTVILAGSNLALVALTLATLATIGTAYRIHVISVSILTAIAWNATWLFIAGFFLLGLTDKHLKQGEGR